MTVGDNAPQDVATNHITLSATHKAASSCGMLSMLCCLLPVLRIPWQLAIMRAKDVAKEKDWGHNFEVRECPADLASDPDIPVVLTMLSNAAGGLGQCGFACGPARAPSGLLYCPAEHTAQCGTVHVLCAGQRSGAGAKSSNQASGMRSLESALRRCCMSTSRLKCHGRGSQGGRMHVDSARG
jgi:hypothetical protein